MPALVAGIALTGTILPANAEDAAPAGPETSQLAAEPSPAAPADQAAVAPVPAEEAPADPAPVDPAPANPTPTDQAPDLSVPSEDAPVDPAPTEQTEPLAAPESEQLGTMEADAALGDIGILAAQADCTSSCASLTIQNVVIGGPASPANWTLVASRNTTTDTYNFTSGQTRSVPRNTTYTLSSTSNSPNTSSYNVVFSCTGNATVTPQNRTIQFSNNGNRSANCIFTYTSTIVVPATITVTKGGDRVPGTTSGVTPLSGATFSAYEGTQGQSAAPSGPVIGSCTTDGTGTCSIAVPPRSGGSGNSTLGYWIVETGQPAGYTPVGSLGTGDYQNTKAITPYRYFTGSVASGQTKAIPLDATRPTSSPGGNSSYWANVKDNGVFPQHCGVSIAMVFDTSASISQTEMTQFKNAAKLFIGNDGAGQPVSGLGNTPSTVSMFSFDSNATKMPGAAISLVDAAGITAATSRINTLPNQGNSSGYTNWDAALSLVAQDATKYDLVLFMTDGDPTRNAIGSQNTDVQVSILESAIFSANLLKSQTGPSGARTMVLPIGVGLSTNSDLNIKAISGPTPDEDYFLGDFDGLAEILSNIATQNCGGTLTVHKILEDAAGNVINTSPVGWDFKATGTGIAGGSETLTTPDDTGAVNFSIDFGASTSLPITVQETQKTGYTLVQKSGANAVCTNGSNYSNDGALGFKITVPQAATVTCTVTNREVPVTASVQVNKVWNVVGPDNVTTSYNVPKLPGETAVLPEGLIATPTIATVSNPAWGTAYPGFTVGGTATVGETASVDATKLPLCTMTSQKLTKVNTGVVDIDVSAGKTSTQTLVAIAGTDPLNLNTYTITNTVTCTQTLSLVKAVEFGSAATNLWTLSATKPSGSGALAGPSGKYSAIPPVSAVTGPVSTNTAYALAEAGGPATYIPTTAGWVCASGTNPPVDVPVTSSAVTVPLGQAVTCTITNTTAQLTLLKHIDNAPTLQPSFWDLTATPASGVAGLIATTKAGADGAGGDPNLASTFDVRPGHSYTVTEALTAAHASQPYRQLSLQKWDGSSWVDVASDQISVDAGQHAVYRFVNTSLPVLWLPLTGGLGTDIFLLGGGIVLLLALTLAAWQRRRIVRTRTP